MWKNNVLLFSITEFKTVTVALIVNKMDCANYRIRAGTVIFFKMIFGTYKIHSKDITNCDQYVCPVLLYERTTTLLSFILKHLYKRNN